MPGFNVPSFGNVSTTITSSAPAFNIPATAPPVPGFRSPAPCFGMSVDKCVHALNGPWDVPAIIPSTPAFTTPVTAPPGSPPNMLTSNNIVPSVPYAPDAPGNTGSNSGPISLTYNNVPRPIVLLMQGNIHTVAGHVHKCKQ
ncbi:hypothetical protein SERLA73DRAFT_70166 [Serpula lacrymans var. lacrymans S7.3]|uniref:Uncharacterized protein n=2 Tax=Serpula lacrymans var. lacrymans TaxID=341189 RepID=F8PM48_SERL3|nr:uncharacterized protein SERLADRAFT_434290 [Serpula lacrymans var. lacrymans S7.9]EGO02680.1 hypothetical protein SERLA73DRAFT_70166 [Serpula lacrymans var. lacrymans S7.3]EGO28380.1 hypothetical protein SERLADRAFT_434290 [Serpula lacrymans var. lacrymans S7.9]